MKMKFTLQCTLARPRFSEGGFFNARVLLASVLCLVAGVFSTPFAFAQTCTQTTNWRAGTGSWFTASNWDNGVPNSATNAQINNGGTAQITSSLQPANACTVTLGNGEFDSGTVSINGASGAALTVAGRVIVGNAGTGSATLVSGASVTSGRLSLAVSDRRLVTSHGTVTIASGSTWTTNGSVDVATHGSIGLLTLDSSASMHVNNGGSVVGTLTLGASATTGFGVTSSTAGKISVQGTATVNGALVVTFSGTGFTPGTRYTLLTATGSRTGTFMNVAFINTPPNVCPEIQYDGHNVYLFLQLMCP
jgi:hypothetical protein